MSGPPGIVARDENAAAAAPGAQVSTSLQDDMIDTLPDFQRWPFLHNVLGECRDSLLATYLGADRRAVDAHKLDRYWVVRAAIFATLAVCLAILQLVVPSRVRGIMSICEGGAVILAMWAIIRAEKAREQWLTWRHKAERCRLLKFGSMIRPDLWKMNGPTSEQYAPEIESARAGLEQLTFKDAKRWLDEDQLPSPPGRINPRDLQQLTQLRDYYREKRLQFQSQFFKTQALRDVKRDERWRGVPHVLFMASVSIVAVHVVLQAVNHFLTRAAPGKPQQSAGWIEVVLESAIAAAALLPVVGSGVRTWHSANEQTRNISRFRAKHLALSNLGLRLEKQGLKDEADAEDLLRDLWCAEQIIESEHREWLRLMIESERLT